MAFFETVKDEAQVEFDPNDINQNKIMAVIAYIGPLAFVPYFACKTSPFAQYHASQGITLFFAELAYSIVAWLLEVIFMLINLWLGAAVVWILGVASLAFLVLAVIGIVNAVNGKSEPLPFIGKYRFNLK